MAALVSVLYTSPHATFELATAQDAACIYVADAELELFVESNDHGLKEIALRTNRSVSSSGGKGLFPFSRGDYASSGEPSRRLSESPPTDG